MNLQILSLIGLAVLTSSVTSGLHHPLVIDYLKYLKNTRYVTTFACSAESETLILSRRIYDLNIKHNHVDLRLRGYSMKELLFYKAPGKHAVIVDCSCPNHMDVLLEASESKYFNLTYNWFMIYEAVDVKDIQTILDPVKGIAINSQFTFAKIIENGTSYNLFDIWSYGRHLGTPIQCDLYAIWREGKGIEVSRELGLMFAKNNRGNLHGLKLRGVTVIDKDDVAPDDVDPIVSRIGLSDGISPFVRYHYFLIKILMDRYNFTLKYRIARAWAGRLPSGYRLGLLGIVQRDEADVAVTGIFPRINRHDDFDFYHSSWKFEAAFLFRVTPDLVNSKGGGSFLIPFSNDVWLLICLSLVVIILWLKIISYCCRQCLGQQGQELFDFIVDAIGGIAQQGLNTTSNFVPVRIVLIHLLIMTLLLYNYYTYFVVGGLLSSPPKGPENLRELIESTLSVSFEDIGYHKILFRESNSSIVKELQRKKLQGVRKALPVYVSVANVIPYLRQGGYSFHSETTVTYNEISKNFKANEICELRMIPGVMETNMMVMIQPKNNMYTEMFKIEMLRALEAGLVKKWLHTIKHTKPECQAGATVHPVAIDGVLAAFYILIFGGILAIIILIAEKLIYKYNFKLDLVYEGYLP